MEMYLKNYEQHLNLKKPERLLKKSINQIISPFDFKFINEKKVANLQECSLIKQFVSSLLEIETTGLFKLQFRIK